MKTPDKSCGNCKHCRKMIPMHEGLEPLWLCDEYCGHEEAVEVMPPNDWACEKWEEEV